jgi:hypothetical protein
MLRTLSRAKLLLLPTLWLAGVLNLACGGTTADKAEPSVDVADSDADPGDDPDDTISNDTFDVFDPEDGRWGVGGVLLVRDGAIDTDNTVLTLQVQSDDGNCELTAALAKADIVEEPPEDTFAWWDLTLEPAAVPACPWRGPTDLQLGLQAPTPDVEPAAARAELRTDTTYGLVLVIGGDARLVGLAGTEEQFGGTTMRVETAPVADGDYRLETLFGLVL